MTPHYICQNCRASFMTPAQLNEIHEIWERVEIGEPMPAGECPHCGALVAYEDEETRKLEANEELFQACKAFLAAYDSDWQPHEFRIAVNMARAAIEKAEKP